MAFDIDVYVSFAHLDNRSVVPDDQGWVAKFQRALELRLSQVLGRRAVVHWDPGLRGNDVSADELRPQLARTVAFVAIVSPRYVASRWAQHELATFAKIAAEHGVSAGQGRLFKVLKDPVPIAQHPPELQNQLGYEFFSVDPDTGKMREGDVERDFWRRLDDLVHDIAGVLQPLQERAPYSPPASKPLQDLPGSDSRERVQLGVSAPYEATPGGVFTARFVAYVDELSDVVAEQLRGLDANVDGGSHAVLGVAPDRAAGWRVGAPITVRVSGEHLRAQPSTRSFEWNGRQNLLSFLVTVDSNAPTDQVALCFEAFIEGVSVAFIPLILTIGDSGRTRELGLTREPVASTAFASYASADSPVVAACLSALQRWDPGLDIFMDCLDLTPNAEWQEELQRVIPTRETFLLFWSVKASQSRWVAWELQHAKASKGLGWIRPMPLDDPAIAPPPDDLKHLHFRDRYLMAREAFRRRADHAGNSAGRRDP